MNYASLAATLLLLVVYNGCAIGEVQPPINLQNTTGNFWVNHTWDPEPATTLMSLVAGEDGGVFTGFNWTGSTWQSSPGIVSGMGDIGTYSAPEVFQKDGTWYLISGDGDGTFTGFSWDGSTWQSSPGIVSDLGSVIDYSAPEVFQKDGTWYLISGDGDGTFTGFSWDGSTWQSSPGIVSGMGDVGDHSTPSVFQKDGTWYLITGNFTAIFTGFSWDGSTWQSSPGIVSGMGDIGYYAAPEVFQKDGTWYLISGDHYGEFIGFSWDGSTWQSSPGIVSDLGDIGFSSTPSVFDQVICAADSYNVSVNAVWHNTSPAYYNDTYSAHAWQNIIVYAFNASDGGTLSGDSVGQNTQVPNNPITITNTLDWEGYDGYNVVVDYDATDADSDAPTFSCNRTDLFTDFDTATGAGNWIFESGTYYIDFGVSDGYGSIDNFTMTIANGTSPPPSSNYIPITQNGCIAVKRTGVTYIYIDNPDLLPCDVTFGDADEHGVDSSAATGRTKHIPFETLSCYTTGVVLKYWANGAHTSQSRAYNIPTTLWCDLNTPGYSDTLTTTMRFTDINDYIVVYGYVSDLDDACWRCNPNIDNTEVILYIRTEGIPRQVNNTIHMLDTSGNHLYNTHVSIYDVTDKVYLQKWETITDGILTLGHIFPTDHDVLISARTFDGVYTLATVHPGIRTTGDFITPWTIPISYNLNLHPVDTTGAPLFNVFAGLSEYAIIDPQAFWGMDLSDRGYVPVTNCSGFAMCDIVAEKEGYADYKVEALNWTSKSALVKDYRHNVVMEEE